MHIANLGLTPQHPLGFPMHRLEPGDGWVWPQNQRKEKQHTQILIPLSVYCLEGHSLRCWGRGTLSWWNCQNQGCPVPCLCSGPLSYLSGPYPGSPTLSNLYVMGCEPGLH